MKKIIDEKTIDKRVKEFLERMEKKEVIKNERRKYNII